MLDIRTKTSLSEIVSYPLGESLEEIKQKYHLQAVRKMSDNENVYGCSEQVKEAIINNSHSLYLYPDGTTAMLKNKLAEHYKIDKNHILIGNGSEEIIRLLTRAYINQNDEAIMADITFPRYDTNVRIEGGTCIKVPLSNGKHDLETMHAKINKHTKMVFICNPNNPTGTITGKQQLLSFIDEIPKQTLIVLDEAYYEYVASDNYLQSVPLLKHYPNLIILRTFSKIYGIAGLRIGYGLMNEEIIKEINKVKDVFNVNHLAQSAALAALNDQSFVQQCARKNKAEIEYVSEKLTEWDISFFPSETNFLYIYSQLPLSAKLIENGLVVRQMKYNGFNDALRITLGKREDNEAFLAVVKEMI